MTTEKTVNFEMYDRSHRFEEVVQARGVGPLRLAIAMDENVAGTATAQLIALAACTILPRASERYTTIDICIPQQAVRIPRVEWRGTLETYLLEELKTVCPWGQFR